MRPTLLIPFVIATAHACLAESASAQRDVSIETLIRSSENRLGVFAKHLRTGEEIAFNADEPYAAGRLFALPTAAHLIETDAASSRPDGEGAAATAVRALRAPSMSGGERRAVSPRAAGYAIAALVKASTAKRDGVLARAFGEEPREAFGGALSPFVETGAFATGDTASPGVAGYATTPRGVVVVAVLSEGFREGSNASAVMPALVAACVRRLAGIVAEPPAVEPDAEGRLAVLSASLHEALRDAALFGGDCGDGRALAADRKSREATAFKLGETARVGVLVAPGARSRLAVQWLVPGKVDDRTCSQSWVDGRAVSDRAFDLRLDASGAYRVRVVMDDRLVMDREFFVTGL